MELAKKELGEHAVKMAARKVEPKGFFKKLRDKAQKVVDDSKKPAKATPGGVETKKGKKRTLRKEPKRLAKNK